MQGNTKTFIVATLALFSLFFSRASLAESESNVSSDLNKATISNPHVWSNIRIFQNKYQPYFEFGGAKYFNQKSNVAGIYDLFIPLCQNQDSQLLFTDLRIFDRSGSSFEGNVHVGYRKLYSSTDANKANRMIGIYGAFDRKRSDATNLFNQITIGAEYWYDQWFIGSNFYQPIGQTKKIVSIDTIQSSRSISITEHYERALPGVDAEIGHAFTDNLIGYVGGYYFHASDATNVVGPKVNITYNYNQPHGRILGILDGISVEAGAQHDKPRGYTAYVGVKFKIGLTNLAKNSNVFGFERHIVELIRRDPDIVIDKAEAKKELASKQGYIMYSQDEGSQTGKTPLSELLKEFGLPENATWQDIRNKFKEYARKYHPDKNKDGSQAFIYYSNLYEKIKNSFNSNTSNSNPNQQKTPLASEPEPEKNHYYNCTQCGCTQSSQKEVCDNYNNKPGDNELNTKLKEWKGNTTKTSAVVEISKRDNTGVKNVEMPRRIGKEIVELNYEYNNSDIKHLLIYRFLDLINKNINAIGNSKTKNSNSTLKNLMLFSPVSQSDLWFISKQHFFTKWLKDEVKQNQEQNKMLIPVYLDKEKHWASVLLEKKNNNHLEVKCLDSSAESQPKLLSCDWMY